MYPVMLVIAYWSYLWPVEGVRITGIEKCVVMLSVLLKPAGWWARRYHGHGPVCVCA